MQIPYFISLLTKDRLIQSTVKARTINDIELYGANCTKAMAHSLQIEDFELTCEEHFKSVSILVTRFATMIEFISPDTKYFEQSAYYFDVCNAGRLKRLSLNDTEEQYPTKSKRVGDFNLFEGSLQATVFQSALYGNKIVLSYRRSNSLV